MSTKKPNVKIENSKVIFSQEILEYFENIRVKENSEWINKYFECLSDEKNLTAEKYNVHHIRPCFSFKDEEHNNRRHTRPFADKFNGNLIKLSIYNHILAHYYLWKIFDNKDSKIAFQKMCGKKNKFLNKITLNELKEIALLKEECTKTNKSKEEIAKQSKEYHKSWYKNNKIIISKRRKNYRSKNKEKISNQGKNYYKENRNKILEKQKKHREENPDYMKEYYKTNFGKISKQKKIYNSQLCYDPKHNDLCNLHTLDGRKYRNKEKYKDINPRDCIIPNELIELVFILFNCFYP